MEKKISKDLFNDEFNYNISNNSMVVIETFGIPNRGMSYLALQDCAYYTGFLRGTFRGYRQTILEEFDIDE